MAGLSPKKSGSRSQVPVVLITVGEPIRAAEPEIPGGSIWPAQTGQLPTTGRRHRAVLERTPASNKRRRARHRLQLIRMSAARPATIFKITYRMSRGNFSEKRSPLWGTILCQV